MNYITIFATHQFFGTDIFKVCQVLTGVKEPENSFDSEDLLWCLKPLPQQHLDQIPEGHQIRP